MSQSASNLAVNLSQLVIAAQQTTQAINTLQQTIAKVFPISGSTATSASAGSETLPDAPALFLVVTLPGGTTYKVPLYNV